MNVEINTLLLYLLICFSAWAFGTLSQYRNKKINKLFMFAAFFVIWFFYAFSKTGTDYEEYKYIFNVVSWNNFASLWIEPGYAFLNVVIKQFTTDPVVAIVLIKSLIMLLVFKTIYDFSDRIDVGLSLLAYCTLAYFDAFCMIRIHLSAALILFGIDLFCNYRKKIFPSILFIISISIHYSSIIFVIVAIIYIFYIRKKIDIKKFITLCAILVGVWGVAILLLNLVITHISFLNKYASKYTSINTFGIGQVLYHVPLILGIYWLWKYRYKFKSIDDSLYSIGIVLMPFSLFFGSMGYKYEVIGRSFVFFLFDWIIFLPALLKGKTVFKMNKTTRSIIKVIVFVYFLIRFWLYISIQNAGLEIFSFIWS